MVHIFEQNKIMRWVGVITAVFTILILTAANANAHTRIELDQYAIIVGWVDEPVIVGERNAIVVEVRRIIEGSDNEPPVEGVEATLDLELIYAGNNFRANLNPTEEPGVYTAELFPTVRGQYSVRLFGAIEEMDVDETVDPEEVLPASRLQFPEVEPDIFTLQARLDVMEAEARTSRLFAYAGVVIGMIGSLLGALGIRKKPAE